MATARTECSCPICCEVPGDIAHALPCGHAFCLGCILRWLQWTRTCPLCKTLISTISFAEREENCPQPALGHAGQAPGPTGNAADTGGGGSAHGPAAAAASQGTRSPAEQGAAGPQAVGGILPELWAELFRRRGNLLNPVRSWLQERLQKIYSERWWQAKTVESGILVALCTFGPDREELAQRLQPRLQQYTSAVVQGVLSIIETQCSREVRRLRGCHAAREKAESPGTGAGCSACPGDAPTSGGPPDSNEEHEAGTSEEAPEGSASTSATVPAEPEQP